MPILFALRHILHFMPSSAPTRVKTPMFSVVVAQCASGGIGFGNAMPWHLPADLLRFKELTTNCLAGKINAVVMGRKTYESLPSNYRPLPKRLNVVLSRNPDTHESLRLTQGVAVAKSIDDMMNVLPDNIDKVFIIGGESVYLEALKNPLCSKIFLTQIESNFVCDKYFPIVPADTFVLTSRSAPLESSGLSYRFLEFGRIVDDRAGSSANVEETQYLDILRDVRNHSTNYPK